jgi:hypothetical protein
MLYDKNKIIIYGGVIYNDNSLYRANDMWILHSDITQKEKEKKSGNYILEKPIGSGGQGN